MKSIQVKQALLLAVVTALFAVSAVRKAEAGTVIAKRGRFGGVVKVTGGPANATGAIEQSSMPGGNNFVPNDHDVTTDGTGKGSEGIGNTDSGALKTGYRVRVVFPGGRVCGPATVESTWNPFPHFTASAQQPAPITLVQASTDSQGSTFLETWEPGSRWTLQIDPSEANFVVTGAVTVYDDKGIVDATVVEVDPYHVTVQIDADSDPLTPSDLHIDGLDIYIPSPSTTTIHSQIGLEGTVSDFLDGAYLGTQVASTLTFVDAPDSPVSPVSVIVGFNPNWTDAGLISSSSDTMIIHDATGLWNLEPEGLSVGPDGFDVSTYQPGWIAKEWLTNGQHGQLIGMVLPDGVDPNDPDFFIFQNDPALFPIGSGLLPVSGVSGRLWLGTNAHYGFGPFDNSTGSVTVYLNYPPQ